MVWRAKTTIEPHGLDIGGTCVGPPAEGGEWMRDAIETRAEGLGGAWSRNTQDRVVGRAKTTIEPHGLDIGGTCVGPPAEGGGWMRDAVEARVEGLGGPGAGIPRMGWFSARNRISSRTGSISVGPAYIHRLAVVEGCGMWYRPELKGWRGLEPECPWVGGFGARN
jgi:hypothetical protein